MPVLREFRKRALVPLTRSWRMPEFLLAYMTTLAWVMSFVVYQGGRLLGFS